MINDVQHWIEYLHFFTEPKGIMMVGAGNGSTLKPMLRWGIENVVVIEADSTQIEKMERAFSLPKSWQVINTVISNSVEEVSFHRANNPAYNGMLNPESLRLIWPNLLTNDTEMVIPVGIDRLMRDYSVSAINWLIIECFPVIDIAQSASELLTVCDVVVLRTLRDESAEGTSSANSVVIKWFSEHSFRLLQQIETDHPQVLSLIFVRDTEQQIVLFTNTKIFCETLKNENRSLSVCIESIQTALQDAEKTSFETQHELENIRAERDVALRENSELKQTIETFSIEKEVLASQNIELENEKQLTQDEVELIRSELHQEQKKMLELSTAKAETEAKVDELTQSLENIKADVEKYRSWAYSLKKQLEEKDLFYNELVQLLETTQQKVLNLQSELEKSYSEQDKVLGEITELKAKYTKALQEEENLTSFAKMLESQIVLLKEENSVLLGEKDGFEENVRDLHSQLSTVSAENKILLTEKIALLDHRDSLIKELNGINLQYKTIESQNELFVEQMKNLEIKHFENLEVEKNNQELAIQITSFEVEILNLKNLFEEIEVAKNTLATENEGLKADKTALINRRDALMKENILFKEQYEKLQTEYQKTNQEYNECQQLVEHLEIKLNENKEFEKDVYEYKRAKNYFINPTYVSRTEYTHYDDQAQEDTWQLEVYLHALGLMKKYELKSVVDLGCGSGYKLMKYLSDYQTVGLELGVNLEFLREKYPDRAWIESDFGIDHQIKTDVLICSDVIEHIVDPDQLIRYIQKITFKYLVLSTPDRELVYGAGMPFLDGPPRNPAHVREWNFSEFKDYISQYFDIVDHRVTNLQQSTQMIIALAKV